MWYIGEILKSTQAKIMSKWKYNQNFTLINNLI